MMAGDIDLYIADKAECDKCKKLFLFKDTHWWFGIRLCDSCYPIIVGRPKPDYWR